MKVIDQLLNALTIAVIIYALTHPPKALRKDSTPTPTPTTTP